MFLFNLIIYHFSAQSLISQSTSHNQLNITPSFTFGYIIWSVLTTVENQSIQHLRTNEVINFVVRQWDQNDSRLTSRFFVRIPRPCQCANHLHHNAPSIYFFLITASISKLRVPPFERIIWFKVFPKMASVCLLNLSWGVQHHSTFWHSWWHPFNSVMLAAVA